MQKLQNSSVAVFGLGGVGSYVVEGLTRTEISSLILIDGDIIKPSNLNRQLFALQSTINMPKTTVAKKRIADINPNCNVKTYHEFILPQNKLRVADIILENKIDFIVDALDTVSAKIEIIEEAQHANIPVISALGCANRLDISALHICDIYKTHTCPLARVLRRELKKRAIPALPVLFSSELPITKKTLAANAWVPAAAGLLIVQYTITHLLNTSTKNFKQY